jgi:hypothetical protein
VTLFNFRLSVACAGRRTFSGEFDCRDSLAAFQPPEVSFRTLDNLLYHNMGKHDACVGFLVMMM